LLNSCLVSIADSIATRSIRLLYRVDAKLTSNVPKILNYLVPIVFSFYRMTGLEQGLSMFLVFPDNPNSIYLPNTNK
jgi:hypothetical protein